MTADQAVSIRTVANASEISSEIWDKLANPTHEPFDPFLCHDFFTALEESQSAVASEGWHPFHLVAENNEGDIIGILPNYIKSHSQGEYVFDHGWADAFYRNGIEYYPKMQCCVPFTPVTGRRLLIGDANDLQSHMMMLSGLRQITDKLEFSSAHITFCDENTTKIADQTGWLVRRGQQFHFKNHGYEDFDDFLNALSSRKRKAIRKERKEAQDGLEIVQKTGSEISELDWDIFFDFYTDTGSRKWGTPYLTRHFFSLLGERLSDHILLIFALKDGKPIAGALNMIGSDALYGRYWGCSRFHPSLHFELCYYQAIDFAIERKLSRVEAGAQGGHKLARGYGPVETYSLHYIPDPRFHAAIEQFLDAESDHVDMENEYLTHRTPFKKDNDGLIIPPTSIKTTK